MRPNSGKSGPTSEAVLSATLVAVVLSSGQKFNWKIWSLRWCLQILWWDFDCSHLIRSLLAWKEGALSWALRKALVRVLKSTMLPLWAMTKLPALSIQIALKNKENECSVLCWNHELSSSTCVRADHDVCAILLNKLLNKSFVLLKCGQNEWWTQSWNTAAAQENIQTNVDTRQIPRSFWKTKMGSFELKCEWWKYSS